MSYLATSNSQSSLKILPLIRSTLEIINAVNSVVLLMNAFIYIPQGEESQQKMAYVFVGLTLALMLAYVLNLFFQGCRRSVKNVVSDCKTGVFLTGLLLFLSPVLRSLT